MFDDVGHSLIHGNGNRIALIFGQCAHMPDVGNTAPDYFQKLRIAGQLDFNISQKL
jgi:hypothetical protein